MDQMIYLNPHENQVLFDKLKNQKLHNKAQVEEAFL